MGKLSWYNLGFKTIDKKLTGQMRLQEKHFMSERKPFLIWSITFSNSSGIGNLSELFLKTCELICLQGKAVYAV